MIGEPAPGPPRLKRVAGALRGLRRSPVPSRGAASAGEERRDPAVLALVSDPFESVGDAHERLVALERLFRERDDRRAVFLTVYCTITDAVSTTIDRREFVDPDWVATYLTTFADHYRRALLAFETHASPDLPPPWRLGFETAVAGSNLIVQDAFLGINAHVNYDLAYTLHEVGIDHHRREKYEDHCAVNDVLRSRVEDIQQTLATVYAPGLATLPGPIDDLGGTFSYFSLEQAREIAWTDAVALTDARWGIRDRLARWFIRTASMGAADFIRSPNLDPELLAQLRALEGDRLDARPASDDDGGTDGPPAGDFEGDSLETRPVPEE